MRASLVAGFLSIAAAFAAWDANARAVSGGFVFGGVASVTASDGSLDFGFLVEGTTPGDGFGDLSFLRADDERGGGGGPGFVVRAPGFEIAPRAPVAFSVFVRGESGDGALVGSFSGALEDNLPLRSGDGGLVPFASVLVLAGLFSPGDYAPLAGLSPDRMTVRVALRGDPDEEGRERFAARAARESFTFDFVPLRIVSALATARTADVTVVPTPGGLALLGLAAAGVLALRRRQAAASATPPGAGARPHASASRA